MMNCKLDRPFAVFDIEATGTSPGADRIVELAIVKLMPDGSRSCHVFRINPGVPIPPETTAIHGITDADVADCPSFADLSQKIEEILAGCDLGGYNCVRYDIPMLIEEFQRAGIRTDLDARRVVDAQRIFHQREPRDLTAALSFFCGEMHLDAHGAKADVEATIRVLEGQLARYTDLPQDIEGLDKYCNPRDPAWVDRLGRLKWADGKVVLNFGKKKGTALSYLAENDPGFIKWILRSDFPRDTKDIVENAVQGIWPEQAGDAHAPPASAPPAS